MTEAAKIAAQLTPAQRKIMLRAKVREPHPFMPTYHAVEFYGGDVGALEVEGLIQMGLFTLPIATGGRGSPTYHGEIHPLGLAVRAELERQQTDGE